MLDEVTIKDEAAPRAARPPPGVPVSWPASSRSLSWPLLAAGLIGVALVALTGMLWVHYGTAVFYETIVAGLAACF
jgi:hypothetical protein